MRVSVRIENLPELARVIAAHPDLFAGRAGTDADDRSTVRTSRQFLGAVRDGAFCLLLVGAGFAGGVNLPKEEPSAAEQHWMDQAERRFAADEAMSASSMKASGRHGVKRAASDLTVPPTTTSGPSHVSR